MVLGLKLRMTLAVTLLFAIIFSFMLAIVYLMGFTQGIYFFIYPMVMAAGMILLQWLLSDKLIQAMAKIQWLNGPEENPKLWAIVAHRAEEAKVNIEKIGISQMKGPNAFVFGIRKAKLVVTRGLLFNLSDSNDDEALDGIIAHEIGHVKHKDLKVMMLISTLPLILYMFAYSLMWSRGYGSRDRSTLILIGVIAWVLYFIMNLGVLLVSRYREYYADRYAKEVAGPRPLARGLIKIAYISKPETVKPELTSAEATLGAFFIMDSKVAEDIELLIKIADMGPISEEQRKIFEKNIKKEKKLGGLEILMTHPLTYKRILRLYEAKA